jgi:DNA uptake protein ComE-like DNA-binding protein
MKKLNVFTSFFEFTKSQQISLVVLLFSIAGLQVLYYQVLAMPPTKPSYSKWEYVDAISNNEAPFQQKTYRIYPFNPNFISDYKAYKFGITLPEINRLRAYRERNLYVNSAEEFQQITGVPDSILKALKPYFKFPDWVNKPRKNNYYSSKNTQSAPLVKIDINEATIDDLKKINGIGEGLSARIIAARQKLGFFVSMDQMQDIWGLQPEVIDRLQSHFEVSRLPAIQKININRCSLKDLAQIPYLNYGIAKSILIYRSKTDEPIRVEDLTKIERFPVDKVNIIALYLEF